MEQVTDEVIEKPRRRVKAPAVLLPPDERAAVTSGKFRNARCVERHTFMEQVTGARRSMVFLGIGSAIALGRHSTWATVTIW
jgi:hypothetical protein